MTALESRFVDAAGVRLHYIECGTGDPPVVLLHGLGSTVTKWRDAMPMCGTRNRTIAVDLPGFGRSDAPRARYTFGFLAGGVKAFLDALAIERFVLVGNSLGGVAAMWLAATWPERVAGLVMVSPALPLPGGARPDASTIARMSVASLPLVGEALYTAAMKLRSAEWHVADSLKRNVADATRVSAETLKLLHEDAEDRRREGRLRAPVLSAQRNLLWMLSARRTEVERTARSLRVPTLLVWGSEDKLVPLAIGEEWVGKIPGAELLVIEGAGHNPQVEVPDRFAEIVVSYADRISSLSGTPGSPG